MGFGVAGARYQNPEGLGRSDSKQRVDTVPVTGTPPNIQQVQRFDDLLNIFSDPWATLDRGAGTHRRDTSLPRHASLLTTSPDTGMDAPAGAGSTDADT
jgi:hypothetical protein